MKLWSLFAFTAGLVSADSQTSDIYGPAAYRKSQVIDLARTETGNSGGSDSISVGFGSCYGLSNYSSKIFKAVAREELDLWVWLGDAAYADEFATHRVMSKSYVQKRYNMTDNDKYYKLMQENTQVIGVWDDHDYGKNNADKHFEKKDQNREIFLDFINEPVDSERRLQEGSAIHQDYLIKGSSDDLNIQVILLDNRYDSDQAINDILGQDQWKWLDQALAKTHMDGKKIDLTLIGSGTQIIPDRPIPVLEKWTWNNKNKLFSLITKNEKSNVVLMSGDVHFAQFYDSGCNSLTGYKVPELTSSGMTHTQADYIPYSQKLTEIYTPDFWSKSENSMELNYGKVTLQKHPETGDKMLTIQANDQKGKELMKQEFNLSQGDLKFEKKNLRTSVYCAAKTAQQRGQIWIIHVTTELITNKNIFGFFLFIAPFFILTVPLAFIGVLGIKILKYINKYIAL